MRPRISLALSLAASAALVGTAMAAAQDEEGGHRFEIELTDEEEVAPAGLAGGEGSAVVTINPGQDRVCYDIEVNDVVSNDGVIMAHIHSGEAGVAGPIVVTLFVGAGPLEDCITPPEDLAANELARIIAKPQLFYVNVHSTSEPGGAVRGQLRRR